jgi:eukaryotic-like serine/threonine-protein kinase
VTLQPGTRLGPYEVLSALGVGGMGEVYKARDTRLDRTVAIKILPETLAADPQFRERFDREARAISQLDHPHICALYDLGEQAGTAYLVMQYLEGETLADRLAKGALPVEQALKTAIEVGSALDQAHRAGIVHRDLKPGNVMLTKGGAKLLDFGLAKSVAPVIAGAGLSMLPTTPPNLTAQGTILGTFQYMAPEQLEGQEADARTDIFAFGAVLYEMLTGQKAFEGKSQASLIGSILKDSPPAVSTAAPLTPPLLDHIVHTCLAKDPDARWQAVRDVQRQLEWVASDGSTTVKQTVPRTSPRIAAGLALAAIAFVAAGVGLATLARGRVAETPAPTLKLSLLPPPNATFTPFGAVGTPHFALSPDGRRIAFVVSRPGRPPLLWISSLDSSVAQELPGTDDASSPFWSPDGESVGFFARGKLKRIGLRDARPEDVANARDGHEGGGAWSTTGVILFGHASGPISRIRASGGPVETATPASKETTVVHRWPQFLPDGRHFLYYDRQAGATYLADLDSNQVTEILKGGTAVYAPPGFLLFPRAGKLWAQALDSKSWKPVGDPSSVVDPVGYAGGSAYPPVAASANGLLAYWNGTPINGELLWFDRSGNLLPSSQGPGPGMGTFSLSPDGRQIALVHSGDVWLFDPSGARSRFSFTGGSWPTWSADGRRLLFRTGQQLVERAISRAEKDRPVGNLLSSQEFPTDWSADGRLVVLHTLGSATGWDIGTMSAETGKRESLLQKPENEFQGRLAPDDHWIAYTSDESGQLEVYVQPLPLTGVKWQISVNGGSQPIWRRDGQELYFLGADRRLMAASVKTRSGFSNDTPHTLFDTQMRPTFIPFPFNYATTDGQRFLVNSMPEGATPTIGVISNWMTALKK